MPIIAATGTSEPDALERLRACGFTDVIGKPVSKSDLGQLLQRTAEKMFRDSVAAALQCDAQTTTDELEE
jgi:CheY-like chemotaxis protein